MSPDPKPGKPKAPTAHPNRRKFRSDGSAVWSKPTIDGPGVWASCVKGKEKQAVGELYDLFDALADELYPGSQPAVRGPALAAGGGTPTPRDAHTDAASADASDDGADEDLSVEEQIAREIAAIKRPRREHRFTNCLTNTPCVVFIACKAPVDPVALVVRHVANVRRTGVAGTRNVHRLVPVSATCLANVADIQALCRTVFAASPLAAADGAPRPLRYKIELRVRNHNTLSRPTIIQEVARCVPEMHTVDLEDPELFVLVEVFKSVCGVSVVRDYYALQKFNVIELANATAHAAGGAALRVKDKAATAPAPASASAGAPEANEAVPEAATAGAAAPGDD